MELESTTAASKTILGLLDENLAKECKTFQSKFNMLTQQIHSHLLKSKSDKVRQTDCRAEI